MSGPQKQKTAEYRDRAESWPMWLEYLLVIALSIGGVACDWYCAYEWFSGKYSFWSGRVLERMAVIVIACAFIAFLTIFWQRGRGRWQAGVAAFCGVSVAFSGNMLVFWIGRH